MGGMYSGQFVYCGRKAALTVGNILPVSSMPEGTIVSNVEAKLGDRGSFARASGTSAIIVGHSDDLAKTRIRLPSGIRKTVQGGSALWSASLPVDSVPISLSSRPVLPGGSVTPRRTTTPA